MQLFQPTENLFIQLKFVLEELTTEQYTLPCIALSGATIGQHVRHIIELFIELNNGYTSGTVDYEKRKRDYTIQSNRYVAMEKLDDILNGLDKTDKQMHLAADYGIGISQPIMAVTNYYRELLYNLEHTVHHMALIRIGINEAANLNVPDDFGVAVSTIKYRNHICAQ